MAPYNADNTGMQDATLAIRQAIADCESSPGTPVPNVVWFPAGTYTLDLIDNATAKNDLAVTGPYPVIIAGQGRAGDPHATTIVEHVGVLNPLDCSYALATAPPPNGGCLSNESTCVPYTDPKVNTCWLKNLLAIQAGASGSTVEDISLDTRQFDAGTSLAVVADNVTVSHVGTAHLAAQGSAIPQFPVLFGGNGATRNTPCATNPTFCHWGNVINDLVAYDEECDDGIVLAMQGNATISNLQYEGSRVALYVDSNVHINGFDYTPGVEACPTQQGFAQTSPTDHIYIHDYVDHNTLRPGGTGVVGRSQPGMNYSTDTLAIDGYVVDGSSGDQLSVQNVNNFSVGPSNDLPCDFGSNNKLHVNPSMSISSVSITGCSLSQSVVSLPSGATITGSGISYTNVVFTKQNPQAYTITDPGQTPLAITWGGGTFQNCPNSDKYLTNASTLTFVVPPGQQGPVNYPCQDTPTGNRDSLYTLDGFGGIHPLGSAPPVSAVTDWPGPGIARGIASFRNNPQSGYVLDGWGGIHAFGSAPRVSSPAYWRGWDIARGIALTPDGGGGWVLDAFGGIHNFGGAPVVAAPAYRPGLDLARGIVADETGLGGWVLDGWGGVSAFGDAPVLQTSVPWPGWDIARAFALTPGDRGGYVLDAWGGLHPFGNAVSVASGGYWPGWDIARAIVMWSVSSSGQPGGWVIDGWGGVHAFGTATGMTTTGYWPGWDIVRGVAGAST